MTERVIAGVKVPLVGDDERMHRAINRSIDDLKKLKGEIASTGVATAKQAREVMVLEERISSMVKAQDKASSTFGSGASRLGQMKEKVSSVAGAMSGLSSSFGSAGGAVGRFGSIASQAFGAFAVGGPIALAIAGVGAASAAVVEGMRAKEEAIKLAQEAAESHTKSMRLLDAQIRAVGTSSVESARLMAEAAAVNATTEYLGSDASRANIARQLEIQDEIAAAKKRTTGLEDVLRLQIEQEALEKEQESAIGKINQLFEKQVELAKALAKEDARAAAAAKAKAKAEAEINRLRTARPPDLEGYFGPKIDGRTQISQSEFEQMLAQQQRGGGIGGFQSSGSGVGDLLALQREAEGKTRVDAAEFERSLKKASKSGGKEFAHSAMNSLLQSGSPFSGGASIAAGMADGVATKLADALKKGFDTLASAVGGGVDFLLGSSKFGGMGGSAAGVASSVFAGHAAVSMAAGPLSAVTGGPVRGAMLAGAAGGASMLPEIMMRATMETKSYGKAMATMNGIFHGFVGMMEPVFQTLIPSLGLVGVLMRNLTQTLAPVGATLGDVLGEGLFIGVKNVALASINAAVALNTIHGVAMIVANTMNWFGYSVAMAAQQQDAAAGFLKAYNDGVASLAINTSVIEGLLALNEEISGTTMETATGWAEAIGNIGVDLGDLGAAASDVASSMRNIPDFFNVARARRDSGATSTAPGGSANIGAAGEMGATTGPAHGGFSVQDGGLYVNTLVVPSENPQQLAMRLMHASYTTSGRQVGSGEPSRTSSYRNGDY